MKWPTPSEAQTARLDANMGGRAERRKMFGHPCYFLNGYMIAGVFGDFLFLRLPTSRIQELEASGEATPFEPIAGRKMSDYVQMEVPSAALFREAAQYAETLPEKVDGKKRRNVRRDI